MENNKDLLKLIGEKLLSENTIAKIWGITTLTLDDARPPTLMPEYVYDKYIYRSVGYWTSAFFPGSIYVLLERAKKYPAKFPSKRIHIRKLEFAARWWSEALKTQKDRTDNHDFGFMIQRSFQREFEYCGSLEAKECLVSAANSLSTRWNEDVGCIRSWDKAVNKRYKFDDMERDFIVIIDNMCNLDLLYYTAHITGDLRYRP